MNSDMTFEEFKEYLTNLTPDGNFSFGFNWLDYVKTRMNEDIINKHVDNLKKVYGGTGIDFTGKSVFDIGSGSGLSSLSFARLGCNKILSVDVDPYSVEATSLTKEKFSPPKVDWSVRRHSILDKSIVEPNSFDIVYSWGVLHHTGDMWTAIKNTIPAIKPGGYLHIALYRSGPSYMSHLEDKFRYKFADRDKKMKILYDRKKSRNFTDIDSRGMNKFHNAIDWLGGLPYEVCDPDILFSFLKQQGFDSPVYFKDKNEGGCFIAIIRKKP